MELLTVIGSILGSVAQPIGKFFVNTIFPFVKKNWKIIIPSFLSMLVILYLLWQLKLANDRTREWQNEAARKDTIIQVAKSTYEKQALELKTIKVENAELRNVLKDANREASMYANLAFEWKAKFDSVHSKPPDTLYIDKPGLPDDSTDRVFSKKVGNEFSMSGWFETKSPYDIYFKEIKWTPTIDIAISMNEDNTWFTDINTNSQFLKPTQINVSIVPFPIKWQYFYGGDIKFADKFSFAGLEFMAGVKRSVWGGYIGAEYINIGSNNYLLYKIGILKFGAF